MIGAVDLWTARSREAAPASVDALLERHMRASDRFADVARELLAANRLDETFVDHHGHMQSFGATILQVLYHNVQHRSEAMRILQRLGVEVQTDGFTQEWEHLIGRI